MNGHGHTHKWDFRGYEILMYFSDLGSSWYHVLHDNQDITEQFVPAETKVNAESLYSLMQKIVEQAAAEGSSELGAVPIEEQHL